MNDATATSPLAAVGPEALSEVFRTHAGRLTRFVYNRLERADWHLAEDVVSETFVCLVRNYADRPIRMESAFCLLARIARCRIADHYRLRRASETAADFTDWFEERRLPAAAAAEETAAVRIEARELLVGRAKATTPVACRESEALLEMAVAR